MRELTLPEIEAAGISGGSGNVYQYQGGGRGGSTTNPMGDVPVDTTGDADTSNNPFAYLNNTTHTHTYDPNTGAPIATNAVGHVTNGSVSGYEAQLVHGDDSHPLGSFNERYPDFAPTQEEIDAINNDNDPESSVHHGTIHCNNDTKDVYQNTATMVGGLGYPGAFVGALLGAAASLMPDDEHCRFEDVGRT